VIKEGVVNTENENNFGESDEKSLILKRGGKMGVNILNGVLGDELEKREIHLATNDELLSK
jgi:hypothetical protein